MISSSFTLWDRINALLFFLGLKRSFVYGHWAVRSLSGGTGGGGAPSRARRDFRQEMSLELLILPEPLNRTPV